MVFHMLAAIKARTKIQGDKFLFLFLYYIFGVDAMIAITMVIVKEIVFTCLIYAKTV